MSKRVVTSVSLITALVALSSLAGCSRGAQDMGLKTKAAQEGYTIALTHCVTCHNIQNPFADRPTGPPIARSSRELLEAKVLHQRYPDGYTPKRPGAITMPKYLQVASRIDDIYAFLQEVQEPDAATK